MSKQTENKMTHLIVDNDRLQTKVEILERGIKNIQQLILSTTGIYSRPSVFWWDPILVNWAEYYPAGRYEEDLTDFFAAVEYLKNEKNET